MPSVYDVLFEYGKITEYVRIFLNAPFVMLALVIEDDPFNCKVEIAKDDKGNTAMIYLRENNVAVGFSVNGKPTKQVRVYDEDNNLVYDGYYEGYI